MFWSKKKEEIMDKQNMQSDNHSNVDVNDLLKQLGLMHCHIIEAECKLKETLNILQKLSLNGNNTDVAKIVEVAENYILSEIPVKTKSFALSRILLEFISLKLQGRHLANALKGVSLESAD